jgi:Family of unknown function (DUF5681)
MAADDDDPVGYRRPPKKTRFQPGLSGNPRGRPKATPNLKTDLLEELAESIRVREGDREMKITKQRAVVKALVSSAIKGDMRAANALFSFVTRAFGDDNEGSRQNAASAQDLEILENFVGREVRKRALKDQPETE